MDIELRLVTSFAELTSFNSETQIGRKLSLLEKDS